MTTSGRIPATSRAIRDARIIRRCVDPSGGVIPIQRTRLLAGRDAGRARRDERGHVVPERGESLRNRRNVDRSALGPGTIWSIAE